MNKIYTNALRSMGSLTNLFSNKNDGVINFCKVEYGNDWRWAYTHFQEHKTLPKFIKEVI